MAEYWKRAARISETEARALFDELDTDHSGKIDAAQVAAATHKIPRYLTNELTRMSADGTLDFDTFLRWCHQREVKIKEAYDKLDLDGSGTIEAHEIITALGIMGLKPTGTDSQKMIQMIDANGDGKIDYSEFRSFMMLIDPIDEGAAYPLSAISCSIHLLTLSMRLLSLFLYLLHLSIC